MQIFTIPVYLNFLVGKDLPGCYRLAPCLPFEAEWFLKQANAAHCQLGTLLRTASS